MIRFGLLLAPVVLVAFGIAAAASPSKYVAKDSPLKSSAGATVGTVLPGTKVAISSSAGENSVVTIDGWQPKSESELVYQGIDSRIVLVRLAPSASSSVSVVGSKTDAYGASWNHVQVSGTIAHTALARSVSAVWTSASSLYGQRCSACHTLHQPTEFTANQWPGIVASMAHNASLSANQEDLIVRYVQAHARQ